MYIIPFIAEVEVILIRLNNVFLFRDKLFDLFLV